MIEIKIIGAAHKKDINIPNQPFTLFGRIIPSYTDEQWAYTIQRFQRTDEMCFPVASAGWIPRYTRARSRREKGIFSSSGIAESQTAAGTAPQILGKIRKKESGHR